MRYFSIHDAPWTETESPPDAPPYLQVDAETATVELIGGDDSPIRLTGAPVDPDADTIHTVMAVDASLAQSYPLCAVYVRGQLLDIEDRRPADAPPAHADAVAQLRSALDEILIPVYIDDAIEEVSTGLDGLMLLHTAQYDDGPDAPPTYFRISAVEDEQLLLEAEHGSL